MQSIDQSYIMQVVDLLLQIRRLRNSPCVADNALLYFWYRYCGRLRIEDVNEDSCPSRGISFSHDVLNVFFHGLFGNLKGVRDLFVGPPLCQVFNDGLFAIG